MYKEMIKAVKALALTALIISLYMPTGVDPVARPSTIFGLALTAAVIIAAALRLASSFVLQITISICVSFQQKPRAAKAGLQIRCILSNISSR